MVIQVFTRLKKYTQHPEFNPDAVGKISVACKSMCQWVLALENYAEVYKVVQPKQRRCEEAQAALLIAKENLEQKQVQVKKLINAIVSHSLPTRRILSFYKTVLQSTKELDFLLG